MKSRTTRKFWRLFEDLSPEIQENARKAFRQWRVDPAYPSLQFKRVSRSEPTYSVRIGIAHRALGSLREDEVLWFWIGSHDEYERLLNG